MCFSQRPEVTPPSHTKRRFEKNLENQNVHATLATDALQPVHCHRKAASSGGPVMSLTVNSLCHPRELHQEKNQTNSCLQSLL